MSSGTNNGSSKRQHRDYLTEDSKLSHLVEKQEFVCLSFLSPEQIPKSGLRGALKVRGVFETREEAEERAEDLRTADPDFHIFVGEVGKWLPWAPDVQNKREVKDTVYFEKELQNMAKDLKKHQRDVKRQEIERRQNMQNEALQNARNPEETRRNNAVERMRRTLAAKKARNANKEYMSADPPATSRVSGRKTGGKRRRNRNPGVSTSELSDMESMYKEHEEESAQERKRLVENESALADKKQSVDKISSQLDKIQALYEERLRKKNARQNRN